MPDKLQRNSNHIPNQGGIIEEFFFFLFVLVQSAIQRWVSDANSLIPGFCKCAKTYKKHKLSQEQNTLFILFVQTQNILFLVIFWLYFFM